MDFEKWTYIVCNDGCTQPLSYAKVGKKYSFIYAPVIGFGALGEFRLLNSEEYDEIRPFMRTNGYSLVFVRKGKDWYLWKYYLEEYNERAITLNAHIFLNCIFQEIRGVSDVSISELYRKCRDDIPEEFRDGFDEMILKTDSPADKDDSSGNPGSRNRRVKMTSKCKEKYGQEWSEELTRETLEYFSSYPAVGMVKRINRGYGIAKVVGTRIQITDPGTEAVIATYDSAQDMVDDGWAVD